MSVQSCAPTTNSSLFLDWNSVTWHVVTTEAKTSRIAALLWEAKSRGTCSHPSSKPIKEKKGNKHGGRRYDQSRTENFACVALAMFGRAETRSFQRYLRLARSSSVKSWRKPTTGNKNIAASSFSSDEIALAAARSCSLCSSQIWSQLSGKQDW